MNELGGSAADERAARAQRVMDELPEFCARVLGGRDGATQAAEEARARWAAGGDSVEELLAGAVAACRAREPSRVSAPDPTEKPYGLAQAVAGELAIANGGLPQGHREVLALRELLGLSHEQVAAVIGIDVVAVASLLARARLRLRTQLRGGSGANLGCAGRDRSLRAIARRQDSEPVDEADTAWLMDHLGHCPACNQAHAAMLEASVCYRAWRVPADARPGVARGERATGSAAG